MAMLTKRSFTAGEISPSLRDRVDLTKYATGLASCHGFIVRSQGGVINRPGFQYINELLDSTKKGWLIPFKFSSSQTYVLVFEHLKIRIVQTGGFIVDEFDSIYEIDTPYTSDEITEIGFSQSADVITFVHKNHTNKNLIRIANDDWQLTDIDYVSSVEVPTWSVSGSVAISSFLISTSPDGDARLNISTSAAHGLSFGQAVKLTLEIGVITRYVEDTGDAGGLIPDSTQPPLTDLNTQTFIVAPYSNTSFTTTISKNQNPDLDFRNFTSGTLVKGGVINVGDVSSGGSFNKKYSYVVSAVVNGIEGLPSEARSITCKTLSQTYGVRLSWLPISDVDYYRIYKDNGEDTGVYGWIGETTTEVFTDYNIAPVTSDSPVTESNPFADGNNPSTTGYYQQRQIFASTDLNPQTYYASKSTEYDSMRYSRPTKDDDSITFTLASNELNEIRHILSLNSLILLTSGGVWVVSEGQDRVLTPASAGARIQSYNGANKTKPCVIDNTVLYVQEKGTRIRSLGYEFSSDSYNGNDLSIMAEHLFEGKTIIQMTYAAEPHGVLWVVRSDGVLLGLTYQREHEVWGWHVHTTDGEFESVVSVQEGGEDAVYVIVKRIINSEVKRYVERLHTRYVNSAVDGVFLDCSLSYNGAPVTSLSGLDHIEGESVVAVADGNVVRNLTVTGGEIILPVAASTVHVGLEYDQYIETLDIDSAQDTAKSKNISVNKMSISVNKSRGGFVSSKISDGEYTDAQEIKPRFQSDGYDTIALKTYVATVISSMNWSKSGAVKIEQRAPLPMEILSVTPEFDIGGS